MQVAREHADGRGRAALGADRHAHAEHADDRRVHVRIAQARVQRLERGVQASLHLVEACVVLRERTLEKGRRRGEPAVQHEAAFPHVPRPAHLPHAVRHARVEHREAVEPRLHRLNDAVALQACGGDAFSAAVEPTAPVVERLRTQELRLAADKGAVNVPLRQGVHERPRPVRHVRVQLLAAPVHVAAQPDGRHCGAPELALCVLQQRTLERRPFRVAKEVRRGRAQKRVLVGHVPVVPNEAVARHLLWVAKPCVEARAQRLCAGVEVVRHEDVLRRACAG